MKKYIYYKIAILIGILAIGKPAFTQGLSDREIIKIVDLYIDEQYKVVTAMLANYGYKLSKATPEYSLKGVNYKGEFTMSKIEIDPYDPERTIEGEWEFITETYTNEKQVTITAHYEDKEVRSAFYGLSAFYKNAKGYKEYEFPYFMVQQYESKRYMDETLYFGREIDGDKSVRTFGPRADIMLQFKDGTIKMNGYNNVHFYARHRLKFVFPNFPIEDIEKYNAMEDFSKAVSIPLKRINKLFEVKVEIGGKTENYIIDSGASEMSITENMEKELFDKGVIRLTDYLNDAEYSLADGSVKNFRRVKIAVVKIGELKILNVEAAIVKNGSPILLGKSFFDKLISWQINNDKCTLDIIQ